MDNKELLRRRTAIAEERENFTDQTEDKQRVDSKVANPRFVELFLERSDAIGAYASWNDMVKSCYLDAGFNANGRDNGVMYHARKKLESMWPEIEKEIRTKLNSGALLGLNVVMDMAVNAKQDSVRLKAATELLNKGGFAEAQKIELKETSDLSEEELQKKIQEKMAASGLQVVKVQDGS